MATVNWYFTPVTVKPNTKYTYSGFYKSNVATKIYIANTNTSNAISYAHLTSPGASPTAWKQVKVSFTTPANIKKITIFHLNYKAGWLQTDDFSLVEVNGPPPSGNIVPNPSVETASGGRPTGWSTNVWGTNNGTFSYLNTGHTGRHSLRTQITAYTNGGATWLHTPKSVSGGRHYLYSDWYQSNVNTEVDADITLSNGTTQTYYLGRAPASASWRQMKAVIDVPANAVSISVYHMIYSKGWLITDDFSLAPYTPAPFDRGLVSITFDDGYTNQYTNAFAEIV